MNEVRVTSTAVVWPHIYFQNNAFAIDLAAYVADCLHPTYIAGIGNMAIAAMEILNENPTSVGR
jgi:hypothetical protein